MHLTRRNRDIVFAPGHAKGKAPYGRYAVKATMTPRSWAEDTVNDVAAMVVATPAGGTSQRAPENEQRVPDRASRLRRRPARL